MSEGLPRTRYVFLLAASHSGSTLTALLLNSHPEIATIGEMTSGAHRVLDGYRCSCRELLTECDFWRRITDAVKPTHPEFNLSNFGIQFQLSSPAWLARVLRAEHRGRSLEFCRDALLAMSPTWRPHVRRTTDMCRTLARAVLAESGAKVLVDSSKLAHRLKFVRQIPGVDLRVIHLVRDGRAVALTYMDADNFADCSDPSLRRGGRGTQGQAQERNLSMTQAADEWRRAMRSAEFALSRLRRDQWIRVRYEDLCARPAETLRRMCTFVGVDPDAERPPFRSVANHVVGNGMRMDSTSEITLDERWKTVLDAAQLDEFDRVAGDVNRRYLAERVIEAEAGPVAQPTADTLSRA